jgi:hypothetical protein
MTVEHLHSFNLLEAILFGGVLSLSALALLLLLGRGSRWLHERWKWFPDLLEGL